jgi:hypothetical protein
MFSTKPQIARVYHQRAVSATRRHRRLFGATCDYEILDAACNLTDAFRRRRDKRPSDLEGARESEGAEKAVRQQRARSEGCLWQETLQSRPSTAPWHVE